MNRITEMRQALNEAEDSRALFDVGVQSTDLNEKLIKALLLVEWESSEFCHACQGRLPPNGSWHCDDCPVDAALTAAGFDTHEKRDEARRLMQEMPCAS